MERLAVFLTNLWRIGRFSRFFLFALVFSWACLPAHAQSVGTYVGSGTAAELDGSGLAAQFNGPSAIVAVGTNLYVADSGGNSIRVIDTTNANVTTLVTGVPVAHSLATDGTYLYFADTANHSIKKIAISDGSVTLLAGQNGTSGQSDGPGLDARFSAPYALEYVGGGDLYVADTGNKTIRKVKTADGTTTTVTGTVGVSGAVDGSLGVATFSVLRGIVFDHNNSLYVADGNLIRRIDLPGGGVTTIGGQSNAGSSDGAGAAASFSAPEGLALSNSGDLLIADTGNNLIRRLNVTTGQVIKLAGTGAAANTNGYGTATASFSAPRGLVRVGSSNTFYVADTGNNLIRRLQWPAVIPHSAPSLTATGATFAMDCYGEQNLFAHWVVQGMGEVNAPSVQNILDGRDADLLVIIGAGPSMDCSGTTNVIVSGLTPKTSYRFFLVGVDAGGFTSARYGASFTTLDVPDAVDVGAPQPGDGYVRIGFNSPLQGNGAPVTNFKVRINGTTEIIVPSGFENEVTVGPYTLFTYNLGVRVSGLTNGVSYSFEVAAENTEGWSAYSLAGSATPGKAPDAPINVTAIAGNAQATVIFSPPANNNGSAIGSYTVTSSPGGVSVSSPASPITVAGLTNGTPYTFTVVAQNDFGPGPASSASNSVTPSNSINATPPTISNSIAGSPTFNGYSFSATSNMSGMGYWVVIQAGNAPPDSLSIRQGRDFYGEPALFAGSLALTAGNSATVNLSNLWSGYAYQVFFVAEDANSNLSAVTVFPPFTTPIVSVSNWAGTGASGTSGDRSASTLASFEEPVALAFDGSDNLYIADQNAHTVRQVTQGQLIDLLAGVPNHNGWSGDGGDALSAHLDTPRGVAVAGNGDVYIADSQNHRIRRVDFDGNIQAVVGSGTAGYGPNTLTNPGALVFYLDVLYLTDNHCVRKWLNGNLITVAGQCGTAGNSGNGGLATDALLNEPVSLAFDSSGNLYIAERSGHVVRKINATTGVISVVAGTGSAGSNGNSGSATGVQLNHPTSVAVDAAGTVYIADYSNHSIRKVVGGVISTVTGDAVTDDDSGDGQPAATARFHHPIAIALDSVGSLYVADLDSRRIRRIMFPPAPPTAVVAAFAPGGATVSFTPPLVTGGPPLTGYTVTTIPASGSDSDSGLSSPVHTITGLAFGTTYTFSVTASNALGSSVASASSNALSIPNDPYWSNIVFASHFDGSNGSAPVDLAGNAIAAGYGAVSTSQSKSGGSSFYVSGTGPGPYIENSKLNFGTGDFTVEMWVYPVSVANDSRVPFAGQNPGSVGSAIMWAFELSNGGIGWWATDAHREAPATPVPVTLNAWQHLAAVRSGVTTTLYLNGTAIHSFADGTDYNKANPAMWLGATPINGESNHFTGYIDDLRVSRGIARYTANFNVSNLGYGAASNLPGTPINVSVTTGNGWARVNFDAPSVTGGSIDSYTVTATPSSGAPIVVTGRGSPIVVTGLSNLVAYSFSVSATNSQGSSSAAVAANTAVSQAKPMLVTAGSGGGPQNNYFSLALAADGKLYSWGTTANSVLGRVVSAGNPAEQPYPVSVLPNGVVAQAIGAGTYHALAAGSDGYVYAWGLNDSGQLTGADTSAHFASFRLVAGNSAIVPLAVAGGRGHSLALGSDGYVYAWGLNANSQLGDGSMNNRNTPLAANLPVPAVAIAAGSYNSYVIGSDGLVYAWGDNTYGQLGAGNIDQTSAVMGSPLNSSDLSIRAVRIVAHGETVKVLGSDGVLYSWGMNGSGQVGDGTTVSVMTPEVIALPATVAAVVGGGFTHSVAIGDNGTLYSWGDNSNGQLGNGTTDGQALTPTAVAFSAGAGVEPWYVVAGAYQNLLYASNGQIYAWGNNGSGQLGDGSLVLRNAPVAIGLNLAVAPTAPRNVVAFAEDGHAGFFFSSPFSNGGAKVSYNLACLASNSAQDNTTHTVTGSASPLIVSALLNNVLYNCTITASNAAGVSTAANVSVTPVAQNVSNNSDNSSATGVTTPPNTTPAGTTTPVTNPSTVFDNAGSIGATVDSSGSVVLPSGGTVTVSLSDKTPENVGIKPAAGTTYTITNGNGSSVKITGLTPDTLLVTRRVGNTTLIEVASGTARIEPTAGTAIPLASKSDQSVGTLSAASGSTTPTAVIVRRDSKGIDAFIETGTTVYKNVSSNGTAVPDTTVYGGETANFSNQGNINQVKLGSLDGDRNLPGDPLKNIPNIDPGLVIPQIDGKVNRLGGQSLVDSFKNQLDGALGNPPGSEVNFDPATGVVVYRLNGVEARFIPLGNLLVSLTGFADNGFVSSNPAQAAAGTFTLIDRGVQLTLASTLGYFNDFNAAVKAADPAGKVTLKASGAIWLDMQGTQYITQPGYLAASSDVVGKPSVIFNDAGQLSFRDSHGGVQTLFPTLADGATLQNVFVKFDPAAVVKLQGDGTAAATLAGHDFVLVPQYYLKPIPIQYTGQPWWVDQGAVYYAMPTLGKGQGFTIK